MSRYLLVALIVLGLALLGLTLVRAQAQPTDDTPAGKAPANCVTVCPLHGEGGNLDSMAGQPIGVERGTEGFHSPDFDHDLPAQESLLEPYLPITLDIAVGPSHDKSP